MKTKSKEIRPMPDPERSFSWSAISSFYWSKEQWWNKYVLHKDCTYNSPEKGTVDMCVIAGFADPECPVVKKTIELAFGTWADLKIQNDKKFYPKLPRYAMLQEKLKAQFNGIPLINVPDGLEIDLKKLIATVCDYKTGRNKWTQARADETGQLTMACLLLWLIYEIRPEDVDLYIYWLPTHTVKGRVEFVEPGQFVTFKTRRTMKQVLEFGQHIVDTYLAMDEYARNRPVLDTSDYSQW